MTKIIKLLLLAVLLYQCQLVAQINQISKPLSREQLKTWWHKDLDKDSIPGVSLEKAYKEILANKIGQEIIVAVVDTKLDIHHEDLKNQIWINSNEIPNNGIDDDKNGYVDDIHGWNYLGNTEGEEIVYSNYEVIRIIRKYKPLFEGKTLEEVAIADQEKFKLYQKALIQHTALVLRKTKEKNSWKEVADLYPKVQNDLAKFFPDKKYSISKLDSLSKVYEKDNSLSYSLNYMKYCLLENIDVSFFEEQVTRIDQQLVTAVSLDYDDRNITKDNPEDINDIGYGNPQVWNDSIPFQHAILVSGILAADRSNNLGIKGVSDQIKIMSLCVASSGGDEHDKDMALAIRYAVDHGAKVINMSFGKENSLHRNWVDQALKYAEQKDVVVVVSAGNEGEELNASYIHYPTNYDEQGNIFLNNFISVGASTHFNDKRLFSSFSNYSNKYVDIFAPGSEMYSTEHNNSYGFGDGTSYSAPIVSGIAALIRSHYPTLTAKQVKQIILDSGTSYEVEVSIKDADGSKKSVPFSELSKSGKIVNAYNALVLAEKMAKK
ncbi:S8 family serine peptidase [Aquimarina litoralis]|uniref:S8 family serine peptidase n=1 Tax=Aquimarina litoralis TaxID=584605 RepID=UPI001C58CA0B|nr:S8 family serine peptidase [Aquimarina litoralis]MBW1297802.1 S8 family serine peptidase [Aquimarina litoralis]